MVGARGDTREELHELELGVRSGLCLAREGEQLVPDDADGRRPRRGVDVHARGRDQLGERRADRRRLGLAGDVSEYEADVVPRGRLSIAGRVPDRSPDDRPGKRILDVREVLGGGGE